MTGPEAEKRAIAAACRAVTPALIKGAGSARQLADLVIEDVSAGLRVGLL